MAFKHGGKLVQVKGNPSLGKPPISAMDLCKTANIDFCGLLWVEPFYYSAGDGEFLGLTKDGEKGTVEEGFEKAVSGE